MYGTRGSRSPDNFQKELQNKMRDQRANGLTSDITPSPRFHGRGGEDELDSDDGTMIIQCTHKIVMFFIQFNSICIH